MAQSAKQNCEICMSARVSEYCLDCCQHFCANCKLTHLRIAVCKNHRFKDSDIATSDASLFCQDHNETYVFMCDQCDTPVCRVCTIKNHKGHSMADIGEVVSMKKAILQASIQSILSSNEMKGLEDFDSKIEEAEEKLDKNTEHIISGVQKQGEYLSRSINRIVGEIVEEVKKHSCSEKEKLTQALSEINNTKAFMDTLSQTQQVMRMSIDDVGLLDKIKRLDNSIKTIKIPSIPSIPNFQYTEGQIQDDVLKNLLGVDFMRTGVVGKEYILSGEVFEEILSYDTNFRNRICLLREEVKTMKNKDDGRLMMLLYRNIMLNELHETYVQKVVKVFIEINETQKSVIMQSMGVLNTAAPGLLLQCIRNKQEADIIVTDRLFEAKNYPISNRWHKVSHRRYTATIAFGKQCKGSEVALAILYALGFHHSMTKLLNALLCDQDPKTVETEVIKRFDSYSILLLGTNNMQSNGIWVLENTGDNIQSLSELDKVILNLLFPPCITDDYNPRISRKTHLLYCGRRVMADHNRPEKSTTDGRCGPSDGANCPACRTIIETDKKKMSKLMANGRFQGWSGLIYCYKNGTCGPNYGDPCYPCYQLIINKL